VASSSTINLPTCTCIQAESVSGTTQALPTQASRSPIPRLDWLLLVPHRCTGTNKVRDISGGRCRAAPRYLMLFLQSVVCPSIVKTEEQSSSVASLPQQLQLPTRTGVTTNSSPRAPGGTVDSLVSRVELTHDTARGMHHHHQLGTPNKLGGGRHTQPGPL